MKEFTKYTIVMCIGTILLLIVVSVFLYTYSGYYQCVNSTEVYCSDKWQCDNACPSGNEYNSCYQSAGEGLASCLYGNESQTATYCVIDTEDPTLCPCIGTMQGTDNCFSGCATDLFSVTGSTACCCKEGQGSNCTQC